MKKNITFLSSCLILLGASNVFGQTQKMVFVEEGTQASCPPCALQNPGFDALLDANTESTIVLKYQAWFPGFDQMNLDNPTEVEDRLVYYGIDNIGVPDAVVNGVFIENDCNAYVGCPACLDQTDVDDEHAIISEFNMSISAEIVNGELNVTGTITAEQAITGDLKLRLVLAEKQISIEDAPGGTNGETFYNHVMKKFVNGTAGITLSSSWAIGDTYTIDESISIGSIAIYNFDQLEVIGFIQNDDDKEVHQSALDQSILITTAYTNNGSALEITGIPETVCSGTQNISPVFTLQNGGNENLISADISYSINGGTPQDYSWSGSISTLGTADVTLPEISFTAALGVPSDITITVSNPNGVVDENATDNIATTTIAPSGTTDYTAQVKIETDGYGAETYWEITDATNTIVAFGGNAAVGTDNIGPNIDSPPTDPGAYGNDATINVEVILSSLGCYSYHITDYYGDGILGNNGYTVKDNNGVVLFDGAAFGVEEIKSFEGTAVSTLKENLFESQFSISPNPAVDQVNVKFNLESSAVTTISVTNILGQVVSNMTLGKLATGVQNQVIDLTALNAGIYQITINAGNSIGTKKVTLVK